MFKKLQIRMKQVVVYVYNEAIDWEINFWMIIIYLL